MSHVWCLNCKGNEHFCGYGLAFGGMSQYTVCECGELLEQIPLDDEDAPMPNEYRIPIGLEMIGGQD